MLNLVAVVSQAAVSKGVLKGLHLLGGDRGLMQEPVTQPPPVLTEDMLQEREAALSALGAASPNHVCCVLTGTQPCLLKALCQSSAVPSGCI